MWSMRRKSNRRGRRSRRRRRRRSSRVHTQRSCRAGWCWCERCSGQ
jgi:hypothetical protein